MKHPFLPSLKILNRKAKKDDRKDKKAQPRVSKKAFGLDEEE